MPTHIPSVHPEHALAYSLVLHPSDGPAPQSIYAIGALEVTLKSGTDIEFKRHSWVYPAENISLPCHDLLALVQSPTYLISARLPHVSGGAEKRSSQHHLLYEQAGLSPLKQPRHVRQFVDVRERVLVGFAGDFGIELARPDSNLAERARLAPHRAQATWLAWAFGGLRNDPDYAAILAGFQAWRVLDYQCVGTG